MSLKRWPVRPQRWPVARLAARAAQAATQVVLPGLTEVQAARP